MTEEIIKALKYHFKRVNNQYCIELEKLFLRNRIKIYISCSLTL